MNYNFDEIVERKNTNAMALEGFHNYLFEPGELQLKHKEEDLV